MPSPPGCGDEGVTARFVQNRTLSGLGLEHEPNITQGAVDVLGLWSRPDIIAGEGDARPQTPPRSGPVSAHQQPRNADTTGGLK